MGMKALVCDVLISNTGGHMPTAANLVPVQQKKKKKKSHISAEWRL